MGERKEVVLLETVFGTADCELSGIPTRPTSRRSG
jgi:hypothetical protein